MITIKIEADFGKVDTMLQQRARQLPFAASLALNRTAKLIKEAEELEIRDVFDRPTPYTQQAIRVRNSTKSDLTAEVKLADDSAKGIPASKFLAAQITGGTRRLKRFEKALQSVGAMPQGYRAVPGAAAKLDAFGNMDRGQIVQILAFFKAFPEAGYRANMNDKGRARLARGSKAKGTMGFAYFVGRPGDRLPLGIWQRVKFAKGSAVRPIIIFVPSAVYHALFDFEYVGKMVAEKQLNAQFAQAFDEAMATAK